MNISRELLIEWNNNRLVNPLSKRKIKANGPTYNKLLNEYNKIKDNNYLKNIIKIQNKYRLKYLSKISGPGYNNPLLCNNSRDVISLDNIWTEKNNKKYLDLEFDKKLLYTYKVNNFIFGLNILSLEECFNKCNYKDPFTNIKFSKTLIKEIKKKINFIKKINIKKKENENLSYKKIIDNKILNIIKILEINDIYINFEWINKIKKNKFIDIYKELNYIFKYHKETHNDLYQEMIKKDYFNYNLGYLIKLNSNQIKGFIFDIIYSILNSEKKDYAQKMTCYIILATFCLVSTEIKNAYPDIQTF